ncbi:MAG: methyltransferase domain-containing protein [Alphaproteobacteria bacterium]|nr:methyltransferase domain-containing protein [Alphaproteobacteria bacterium]
MQIETEGLHPATELCFLALQWLQNEGEFANILDVGCGNGILSVLCAHLWDARVLAVDISEQAIIDTQTRVKNDQLSDKISVFRSDGFQNEEILARSPFDLIMINLLAEPIFSWAGEVKKHLSGGGYVYLGGILQWKTEQIAEAYTSLDFEIKQEFKESPWCGLLLCHKSDTKKAEKYPPCNKTLT